SPSETPVRISPPTIRARKSRSSSDAREARRARRSSRARRTPEPAAAATSANASATWRSVRGPRSASASPGGSAGNPRTPSVRRLGAGPASEAVILVTPRSADVAGEGVRLLGLVPAADAGPWPETWHAVLPLGAPLAMLAHAVGAAFADLDAAAERARLERDL